MVSWIFRILGHIPLRAGYIFADFLAWVAGDVVRYRRRVIYDNLQKSFPEKPEREIRTIARSFYHFLADYFVETIRLGGISECEIRRRMTFENVELLDELARRGVPVAVMLGHYCNWEWISTFPLHQKVAADASQIYHPLESKAFDKAFGYIRSRFGAHNVAMRDTMRYLAERRSEGVSTITGFIADQSPSYASTHLWLDFLNHETGVYTGPEKLMRRWHGAMVYARVERPRRGYYHCRFELIAEDVSCEPEYGPTMEYFKRLEHQIKETPHLWLWSHRRWKRPRLPK